MPPELPNEEKKLMITRREQKALSIIHKVVLLDRLHHRMEVAQRKNDAILLEQLTQEANYINPKPLFVKVKSLLSEAKAEELERQKGSWIDWLRDASSVIEVADPDRN